MTCNELTTVVDVLSSTLIPKSLESVCLTSLKLIENASSNQVSAAVEYNQHKINALLIQLLTINFLSQNQQQIENDVNDLNHINVVQLSQQHVQLTPFPMSTTQSSSDLDSDLEEYCQHKLLSLSPILGFSRKNYFLQHNISNDIQMEIISYLKPIEIFKNITLTNKQFNENVTAIHQSYRYANIFCDKRYGFESFTKVKKYCDSSDSDTTNVDWRRQDGKWIYGQVDSVDTTEMGFRVSAMIDDRIVRDMVEYTRITIY